MWDGDDGGKDGKGPTPKQRYSIFNVQREIDQSDVRLLIRLMGWIQTKIPEMPISNFTSDWNDGRAVGALVDAVAPGQLFNKLRLIAL